MGGGGGGGGGVREGKGHVKQHVMKSTFKPSALIFGGVRVRKPLRTRMR